MRTARKTAENANYHRISIMIQYVIINRMGKDVNRFSRAKNNFLKFPEKKTKFDGGTGDIT